MPARHRSTNTSGNLRTRRQESAAAAIQRSGHSPDLSHIAPGLRALAVPVAELGLMVGNPRYHPAKNLEAIKATFRGGSDQGPTPTPRGITLPDS
jgi:hypothetical protein